MRQERTVVGRVIEIGKHRLSGPILGVRARGSTHMIPFHDGDIRMLELGERIAFRTTREGGIDIVSPKPRIDCKPRFSRERER